MEEARAAAEFDDGTEGAGAPEPTPLLGLSAPGVVDCASTQQRSHWLGFRVAPALWPGYVRIAFASDLNFSAATLDVHESAFPRLREGIERFLRGQAAGIHLPAPAELNTPRLRRVIGAILLQPTPPIGKLELVGLDYEPVATVRCFQPDMVKGMASVLPVLDQVPSGPARRAVRRFEMPEEALMPESWMRDPARLTDAPALEIAGRHSERYAEVRVKFAAGIQARVYGQEMCVEDLSFDFTDWPVVAVLNGRSSGAERIEICRMLWQDIAALETRLDDALLPIRSSGHVALDIPTEDRARLVDEVMRLFRAQEARFRRVPLRELQLQLLDDEAPPRGRAAPGSDPQLALPLHITPGAGEKAFRGAPPRLGAPEQADLFAPGGGSPPTPSLAGLPTPYGV